MARAQRSARAQAKASRQHAEYGHPSRSFRSLLTHLAILTHPTWRTSTPRYGLSPSRLASRPSTVFQLRRMRWLDDHRAACGSAGWICPICTCPASSELTVLPAEPGQFSAEERDSYDRVTGVERTRGRGLSGFRGLSARESWGYGVWLFVGLGAVAGGSLIAATASSDMWVLGYVIYGLFAIFFMIIPNIMAFRFAIQVPFPSLVRTAADIESRWRPAAMIIVAGLVILMIHLAFAPWPDMFRHRFGG